MKDRRIKAVQKFAQKTSKNPIYNHWFKKNPNQTSTRKPRLYLEEHARTNRLYNSPLFHMRRVLNNSDHDNWHEMNYMDLAYLFDEE